jgi:hypothetical protein
MDKPGHSPSYSGLSLLLPSVVGYPLAEQGQSSVQGIFINEPDSHRTPSNKSLG